MARSLTGRRSATADGLTSGQIVVAANRREDAPARSRDHTSAADHDVSESDPGRIRSYIAGYLGPNTGGCRPYAGTSGTNFRSNTVDIGVEQIRALRRAQRQGRPQDRGLLTASARETKLARADRRARPGGRVATRPAGASSTPTARTSPPTGRRRTATGSSRSRPRSAVCSSPLLRGASVMRSRAAAPDRLAAAAGVSECPPQRRRHRRQSRRGLLWAPILGTAGSGVGDPTRHSGRSPKPILRDSRVVGAARAGGRATPRHCAVKIVFERPSSAGRRSWRRPGAGRRRRRA